jgi:hypothetical protein
MSRKKAIRHWCVVLDSSMCFDSIQNLTEKQIAAYEEKDWVVLLISRYTEVD